jgi:DNA-binding MarR family transcriptional regulator
MKLLSPIEEIGRDSLAVRVRLLSRSVSAIFDQALSIYGVTIAQVNLLTALGQVGPCAPRKLGEVLQLERSTLSRNLELLIAKGLVVAIFSDLKGIREVAVTNTGHQKIDALLPDWRAAQKKAHQLLGRAGVRAVYDATASIWTAPLDSSEHNELSSETSPFFLNASLYMHRRR